MDAFLTSPWLIVLLVGTFVGSLVALPFFVAVVPRDYFAGIAPPVSPLRSRRPLLYAALRVVSNVIGALLVLAGIAMLVLPGQGLLTILIGLILMNFPGKRRLELYLVRQGPILRALNWMRARAGRDPLAVLPAEKREE